ncbi:hypothetical protein LA080_014076 [Diaporthe eres]|nr:hypothetical protein LA080_014076 [Diaporthe eres]
MGPRPPGSVIYNISGSLSKSPCQLMRQPLVSGPFMVEAKSKYEKADSRVKAFLRFQTRAAEFLLGEMSLPGSPFSLSEDPSTSLAETISAVKSLMDTLLSAEPDQELFFTNLAWVTLGYGLSLGVKLDILCTTCGISPATVIELRRSLDIAQTLRGLIERLRMSISQHKDTDAESHPLFQFLSRAEAVESILHGLETVSGTMQETHRRDALPGHSHPTTKGEVSFGTTYNQDVEFAYDPEMLAFEGLDFEGMDFAMDPQEVWNPFVFPDGA